MGAPCSKSNVDDPLQQEEAVAVLKGLARLQVAEAQTRGSIALEAFSTLTLLSSRAHAVYKGYVDAYARFDTERDEFHRQLEQLQSSVDNSNHVALDHQLATLEAVEEAARSRLELQQASQFHHLSSSGNRALYDVCIRAMAEVVCERTAAAARIAQVQEAVIGTAEGLFELHARIANNAGMAASRSVHPAGEEFVAAVSAQAAAVAVGMGGVYGAVGAGEKYRKEMVTRLAMMEGSEV